MQFKIKKVLIINTGGGIGDALQFLKIFKLINIQFKNPKIFYYSCDLKKFWYENILSSLKPRNVQTIKHFPDHFGFRKKHFFIKYKKKEFYDLIIDSQSKLRNSLIYKRIPHEFFFSFAWNGLVSTPFLKNNNKHVQLRIVECLEKFLNKKIDFEKIRILVKNKYNIEAKRILKKKQNYIGFSLKAGHPTRVKEFNINEILKVAAHFSRKNYIPAFFVEEKHDILIQKIQKKIPNAFFPEHYSNKLYKNPSLVIALANKMDFNISIDNGVMHMLGLADKKLFCFFNKNSEKFKPIEKNVHIFDCELKNKKIDTLKSQEIITFIEKNLNLN